MNPNQIEGNDSNETRKYRHSRKRIKNLQKDRLEAAKEITVE